MEKTGQCGCSYNLLAEDLQVVETVTSKTQSGETRFRTGKLYRKDKSEEKFPNKERGTLKFQTELMFDAVKRAEEEWIRVFDQEDGVLRFDRYQDVGASHGKVLHDGNLQEARKRLSTILERTHRGPLMQKLMRGV